MGGEKNGEKEIHNSVQKANVEFVKVHILNVSVQLRGEDGITPLWNQVACLLRVLLIQTEQTLKAARICVSLSNVQSQTIPPVFIH